MENTKKVLRFHKNDTVNDILAILITIGGIVGMVVIALW